MPRQLTAYGNIQAGKLRIAERGRFDNALAAFPDGMVTLSVKVVGKKRSNPQNAYYHAVVVKLIAEAMTDAYGEDVDEDEAHQQLKARFNMRTIETENGSVRIPGSTRRLDTAEFAAYVEKCRNWAADFFGINIPDPVKILSANQELKC